MGLNLVLAVQTGGYVSALKAIPVLLVLLLWARLLTWVDKDAPAAHLPREALNLGFLGGMVAGFGLFFFLPTFAIAFPVLVFVMLVEAGTYLIVRQQKVGLADLNTQFRDWLHSFRSKEKKVKDLPNQVNIIGKGGSTVPPPDAEDAQRPAYDALQQALVEPLHKGSEQIDFAPSENAMAVKYLVDGVSYRGSSLERYTGGGAIGFLKGAAGLDVEDKRKPQRGMIKLMMDGRKIEFRMDTAGSTAGEFLRLLAEPKRRHDFKVDTIGFSDKQRQIVEELIADRPGVVLVAAPKSQGLTSALYAILRSHDAFLEHIHTVERAPDIELEGITQNKLPANAGAAEEAKLVSWVVSQEPEIVMVSRVESRDSALNLIKWAREGKRVYVGINAGSTFDALSAWRKLVNDDKLAAQELRLVIAGRVIRKLCNACKVGYSPDPDTLRKLNMSADKVTTLFQARTQPLRDPKGHPIPCEFCKDLRFKGRTGVFEFLVVDDDVKQAVMAGGSPNQLKAVFRKQRGKYLQEEALTLVEKGETSVQEVLRVLKGGNGSPPAEANPAA